MKKENRFIAGNNGKVDYEKLRQEAALAKAEDRAQRAEQIVTSETRWLDSDVWQKTADQCRIPTVDLSLTSWKSSQLRHDKVARNSVSINPAVVDLIYNKAIADLSVLRPRLNDNIRLTENIESATIAINDHVLQTDHFDNDWSRLANDPTSFTSSVNRELAKLVSKPRDNRQQQGTRFLKKILDARLGARLVVTPDGRAIQYLLSRA